MILLGINQYLVTITNGLQIYGVSQKENCCTCYEFHVFAVSDEYDSYIDIFLMIYKQNMYSFGFVNIFFRLTTNL